MMYADLVLEGGGVKGIGLVGAISVLQERGYTFKRVAGTSAGAIVGSLVAADIAAPELEKIMRSVDYTAFQDGGLTDEIIGGRALNLLFHHGIHPGNYLREWLGQQLDEAGVRTFADLHYQDGERPLPPDQQYRLVVMASDISQGFLQRLPWDYDHYGRDRSAQHVVEAVRASMSLPFFHTPLVWDTAEGNNHGSSTAACCPTTRSTSSTPPPVRNPGGRRSASNCPPVPKRRSARLTTFTARSA